MALLFRLSNRQLLKYVNPEKSLILLARPITMNPSPAQPPSKEGYDERNMRIGRPMSPHLTIYAPQLTAFLSISHRATGMGLGIYLSTLSFAAMTLSHPISYYLDALQDIGWFTHFVLKMFIAFPFCYHYINGIRHLSWDMGKMLAIKDVYMTGYVMSGLAIVSSIIMSL